MRIECPSCFAAYIVPDSLVTAGRVVRCARCGGDWAPMAATAAPEPEGPEVEAPPSPPLQPPPSAPAEVTDVAEEEVAAEEVAATTTHPSAMERLAAQAPWPQPSTRLRLAWAASLVLLVLAAGAAYAWRGQIVAEWPPSARAYALFGLQPQTEAPR
jgi:predicted Zn finger-like uncharacterized protein